MLKLFVREVESEIGPRCKFEEVGVTRVTCITILLLFKFACVLSTCLESKPLRTISCAPETLIVVRPVSVSDR